MHFSLRDWVALLGFLSLVSSVVSVSSPLASLDLHLDGRDTVTIRADGGVRVTAGRTSDETSMNARRRVAALAPGFSRTPNAAKPSAAA